MGLHRINNHRGILYSEYKEVPCRNQERYIQMSEAEEEKIREEYFLLHSRNTHNTHILNRIYTRYLKCIAKEKKRNLDYNRMNPEQEYKGGHLG